MGHKCDIHTDRDLEFITISNSVAYTGRFLKRYYCSQCVEEENGKHHKGYECPKCGEVWEKYKIRAIDPLNVRIDPGITARYTRTTQAFEYICSKCNTKLGAHLIEKKALESLKKRTKKTKNI